MLNDPFVRETALRIAKDVVAESEPSNALIVNVYRQVLQRSPTSDEARLAENFLNAYMNTITESQSNLISQQAPSGSSSVPVGTESSTSTGNEAAPEDGRPANIENEVEVKVTSNNGTEEAVAAFVQSLIASAEFRYVP
jgi:hypothetical protein